MTDVDSTSSNSPRPSSSGPPSRSGYASQWTCWATHATGIIVALAVAWPLGRALPSLVTLATRQGEWKPLATALLALGMIAAPVPTLGLVRALLPLKKE